MELQIKVKDKRELFEGYLTWLQPVLKLRPREAQVLRELIYQSFIKQDIRDIKDRFKIILSYESKMKMIETLKDKKGNPMPYPVFRNALHALKKKGILKAGIIVEHLLISPEDELKLTYKFHIDQKEDEK